MGKFYCRFRIMLMTLTLGLTSVWFFHNFETDENEDLRNVRIVTIAPKQPRFTETFRACGMGYIQGYVTNDDIALTEGTLGCDEPKKKDKRVIQKDEKRIISKIEKNNLISYEIYQVEKGLCINSPTIELGIELEIFLEKMQ